MDLVRREADRAAAAEFVALDIRGEAESPANDPQMLMESSFVAAKEFERDRRGDANSSSTGVAGVYEKQTVPVHVDDSPREHLHPSTPTAGGAKRRRSSRRVPGWRDPRKILFAFAALFQVNVLLVHQENYSCNFPASYSLDEPEHFAISCASITQLGILIAGQNVRTRSSVGTLILLYFTLSMGKMTGGQDDGQ